MEIKIALAGNPNAGKTTLFNALTGSNQFVGNWPGVTVEKKEGKLKGNKEVTITDLPGIYSLSPYTLEEVVARNYLISERPDAILNIIDGTNLERNLYLTTQLVELGIPVVAAVNMMDVVKKNGDVINFAQLEKELGCKVVEISALKGTGIKEAAAGIWDRHSEYAEGFGPRYFFLASARDCHRVHEAVATARAARAWLGPYRVLPEYSAHHRAPRDLSHHHGNAPGYGDRDEFERACHAR